MYFFTDFFRQAITANPNLLDNAQVKVVLFRYAPALEFPQARWLAARTVAELTAYPGWDEVVGGGYPLTTFITTSTRVLPTSAPAGTGSKYVMFSEYPFVNLTQPVEAEAIGFFLNGTISPVTNPLLFVTNRPTGGLTNIYPGDSLTANPDSSFPDATNRWLMSWAVAKPDPIEGPLEFFRAPPAFEVSGMQHVWLYPQRANMIANPSFEAPGTKYWGGNGTLSRVTGAPGAGAWAGEVAGVDGLCVLESNIFPTRLGMLDSDQWTIQALVKGDGLCKVGLVSWDPDYRATMVDWGEETWELDQGTWTHVAVHRSGPQAHVAMVRIESILSTSLTIDQVLCERGYLKDWLYFDGDDKYGARGDFSWYGGANRHGATYSLWYNNRKAVTGRLFAHTVDPDDPTKNVTDEDMEAAGLVYRWVPAGITVKAWLDVFYPHDLALPIPDRTVPVLPYYDAVNQPGGVINPWPNAAVRVTWKISASGIKGT